MRKRMSRKSTFDEFEELGQESLDESKSDRKESGEVTAAQNKPETPSEIAFTPMKGGTVREEHYGRDEGMRDKRKQKSKTGKKRRIPIVGIIFAVIQLICSGVFLWSLGTLDMLPMRYFALVVILLLVLAGIAFALQWLRHVHIVGKVMAALVSILLIIVTIYIARTHGLLQNITAGSTYQTDKIVVAVLQDDEAESIVDAVDYEFGITRSLDREKVDLAISQINDTIGVQISTVEYDSYSDLVNALYDGDVEAIIYNQAMNDLIEENNEGFTERVRILDNFDVQTEVFMEDVPDLPITEDPFILFLSGMDVYGDIQETGRSDVNILACVNPTTKQVLLISIPRDAYVEIPGITSYGEKDKLTHAGMYGVQYSMNALEELFDVDVNYYVRVNFSSLIMMVDALGGIDVDSDYAFSTYYKQYTQATDTWEYYNYTKGTNHLNGDHALAFARERMNLPGGDYQRGKNQQKVIEGLLEKIKSPSILLNYTDLLDSLSGKMDTSLSSQQIASLVKMQLNDGAEWNIVSASVYGTSSQEYCASYSGSPLSVEILDDDSIAAVKEVIDALFAGEVISEPRTTDLESAYEVDEDELDSEYYMNNHASDWEYGSDYFTVGKNGGGSSSGSSDTEADYDYSYDQGYSGDYDYSYDYSEGSGTDYGTDTTVPDDGYTDDAIYEETYMEEDYGSYDTESVYE